VLEPPPPSESRRCGGGWRAALRLPAARTRRGYSLQLVLREVAVVPFARRGCAESPSRAAGLSPRPGASGFSTHRACFGAVMALGRKGAWPRRGPPPPARRPPRRRWRSAHAPVSCCWPAPQALGGAGGVDGGRRLCGAESGARKPAPMGVLLLSVLVMLLVRPNWLPDVGSSSQWPPRPGPDPHRLRPGAGLQRWLPAGEGSGWIGWPGLAVRGGLRSGLATASCSTFGVSRCMPFPAKPGGARLLSPAHRPRGDGDGPLRREPCRRCCPCWPGRWGQLCGLLLLLCAALRPGRWPSGRWARPDSLGLVLLLFLSPAALVAAGAALGAGWGWLAWASTPGVAPLAAGRRPAATCASMGGDLAAGPPPGSGALIKPSAPMASAAPAAARLATGLGQRYDLD